MTERTVPSLLSPNILRSAKEVIVEVHPLFIILKGYSKCNCNNCNNLVQKQSHFPGYRIANVNVFMHSQAQFAACNRVPFLKLHTLSTTTTSCRPKYVWAKVVNLSCL